MVLRLSSKRLNAKSRFNFLCKKPKSATDNSKDLDSNLIPENDLNFNKANKLELSLAQANLNLSPTLFLFLAICSGILCAIVTGTALSFYCIPVFLLIGTSLPFIWLSKRIRQRASEFSEDYPAVLLATATSIKAGMTPLAALGRATELLPNSSLCKAETKKLMAALDSGLEKKKALALFGQTIALTEIELFRTAFLLVIEHGGPFVPTLERLAKVTRDRVSLIASAGVSTASMRMTGNVLLAVIPIILLLLSSTNKDYWNLLSNEPLANTVATIGICIITVGYLSLRKMSDFRP